MKRVKNGFVKNLHYLCLAGVIALGFVTIVATGGGGGGGSSSSSGGTGSVAVVLTDGPADEYAELWVTITEVTLIPAPGSNLSPATVYHSADGCQVDLLEFRDDEFLFTLKHGIPAGTYEKIRLGIAGIEPVGEGPCEEMEVKLPSGKIDLGPRGTFEVKAGETVGIRLDIDANKSINLHTAGQSGKCIFRPVVFVDIGPIGWMPRCPKILKGTLAEFIGEYGEGFRLALFPKNRGTVDVYLSDTTVIFNVEGLPGNFDDLKEEQTVWVRGRLDGNGHFQAREVAIGELLVLKGTVESAVDNDTFTLALDPGQSVTDETITVTLSGETLILVGCDDEVIKEAIQPGLPAWVSGKLSLDDQMLQAVAVFLKPISGEVISVQDAEHSSTSGIDLTIRVNGDTDVVAFVPDTAPIRLVGDGDVPLELLCPGRQVNAVIDPDQSDQLGVLTAGEIKVQTDHHVGYVDAIDEAKRIIFIDGRQILVQNNAVIMDLRGKEDRLSDFGYITSDDKVSCFGLEACETDTTENDFYAFVILLIEY
jgi:hypothetical protein